MHTLDLAIVDLLGADAESFLQSQTTNDLADLSGEALQLNGYCSPKGRLLALFWQWRIEGGVRIALPADVVPSLLQRWPMFVLRSDVKFSVQETLKVIAVSEPGAGLEVPGTGGVRMVVGSEESLAAIPRLSDVAWRLALIRARIPRVVGATVDHFIPQMLDLEALGGLSFTKGCYPGQEIVARAQYRGTLKRHLSAWSGSLPDSAEVPEPGASLDAAGGASSMAEVVDAVGVDGRLELLAVVKDGLDDDELLWQGVQLQRRDQAANS